MKRMLIRQVLLVFSLIMVSMSVWGQSATIKEESRTFDTYPFSDPNPIPILTSNTKIYPYHKFEGYSHDARPQTWKVVTLENDYIKVFVLPEVGGKVWGAIDKTNGEEFIYRNEVMKFRNISMRGPWTSGGIEFNFGIIGHHPSTATPVDYTTRTLEDGSVSCVVGNIDLPSHTQWRVDITLPPDKAYFETKVLWYNPSSQTQSYYNWMTAAAFAKNDLEFYTPGDVYLKHSGEAKNWPLDKEGHNLAKYAENNFGPSKSYHVVGEYNDFFGGYFHDDHYGFGHWAHYEEMPGQKLWLWALSRSGGIWEDLLTDSDGQYIEFQAGRLFDQYSPGEHRNPITQAPFPSHAYDTWREIWFPVKEIGGITEVSPHAVLHLIPQDDQLTIGIQALGVAEGTLKVWDEEKVVFQRDLAMQPAQVKQFSIPMPSGSYQIRVPEMDLKYTSDPADLQLRRPFEYPQELPTDSPGMLFHQGLEAVEYREFEKAHKAFTACLQKDPAHIPARVALADLHYGSGQLDEALKEAHFALSIDTYHAQANYVAGNIYRAQGDHVNALESLGWAARSPEFSTAAYTQMAEISLGKQRIEDAMLFAMKALHFNASNVRALQVKALAQGLAGNDPQMSNSLDQVLKIDPLNHFALWEKHQTLKSVLFNELPAQSYMELAVDYYNWGLVDKARQLFQKADNTVSEIWMAYLDKDANKLETLTSNSVDFVFPFRRETLPVLEWANEQNNHWSYKYYLGLNYWGRNRVTEAAALFKACAQEPQQAIFYITRAHLLHKIEGTSAETDLQMALKLDPQQWRFHDALIDHYGNQGQYQQQLKLAAKAHKKWPQSYNLGLSHARSLLKNQKYPEAIKVLDRLQVLPFEGASASRRVYEQAHLNQAMALMKKQKYQQALDLLVKAAEWPENLGVGKPFDPDLRKVQYLKARCEKALGKQEMAQQTAQSLMDFTGKHFQNGRINNILGIQMMKSLDLDQQARTLMESTNGSQNSIRWKVIKAFYEGDDPTLNSLLQGIEGQPLYEEYQMVKNILAI